MPADEVPGVPHPTIADNSGKVLLEAISSDFNGGDSSCEVSEDGAQITAPDLESDCFPRQDSSEESSPPPPPNEEKSSSDARQLTTAGDCRDFIEQLRGGVQALQLIAELAAGLNHRPDPLRQEQLTFILQSWTNGVTMQLLQLQDTQPAELQDQIALAVESVAAAAVRERVAEVLHRQHFSRDTALLRVTRSLYEGTSHLMARTASMDRDAELAQQLNGSRATSDASSDAFNRGTSSSWNHVVPQSSFSGARLQPQPASYGSCDYTSMHEGLSREVLAMCGVDSRLWGLDFSEASATAKAVQSATCPLEAIKCLLGVTTALVAAAGKCRTGLGVPNGGVLSSDDLLPLLIATLIKTQLPHLFSCLQYVAAFHCSGDWNGMDGFQVATFEAAVAFLMQQGDGPTTAQFPYDRQGLGTRDSVGEHSGSHPRQSSVNEAMAALLEDEAPLTFTSPAACF